MTEAEEAAERRNERARDSIARARAILDAIDERERLEKEAERQR